MKHSVVIICGLPGSGKTTLGKRLFDEGFIHIEMSDIVKDKYVEMSQKIDFLSFVKSVFCSSKTATIFAEEAVAQIRKHPKKESHFVVTGFRTHLELKTLLAAYPQALVVCLKNCYHNRAKRKPDPDSTTGLSFSEKNKLEILWGSNLLEEAANLVINTSLEVDVCARIILAALAIDGNSRMRGN